MTAGINFKASAAVRAALSAIGRTEDLRFSPDNRLLAIAGYARKRLLVLRVDITAGPDGPDVTIHDHMELTSDDMGEIHGLDFIDDRTLAIANRDGVVAIFSLPREEPVGQSRAISAIRRIRGKRPCKLNSPGSIVARRESRGGISLLVCNKMVDLAHVKAFDPKAFREEVKKGMNERLGGEYVAEVMLEQLDYLSKEDVKENSSGKPTKVGTPVKIVETVPAGEAPVPAAH